jgi:hypothetical protein
MGLAASLTSCTAVSVPSSTFTDTWSSGSTLRLPDGGDAGLRWATADQAGRQQSGRSSRERGTDDQEGSKTQGTQSPPRVLISRRMAIRLPPESGCDGAQTRHVAIASARHTAARRLGGECLPKR